MYKSTVVAYVPETLELINRYVSEGYAKMGLRKMNRDTSNAVIVPIEEYDKLVKQSSEFDKLADQARVRKNAIQSNEECDCEVHCTCGEELSLREQLETMKVVKVDEWVKCYDV